MKHPTVLLVLALALATLPAPPTQLDHLVPPAAAQAPGGVRLTLSVASEEVAAPPLGAPVSPGESSGLLIQLRLENRTGADISGLRVSSPAPPRSRVTDSWAGQPGASPGSLQGAAVIWTNLTIRNGERLGPFTYRVVPGPGADGAEIFRRASVSPQVTWTTPASGQATVPLGGLPLNGLWGEAGLRRTVLPTGLTIFTRERPDSATVAIRMAARAGSRDEDQTTRGGSHWLEHAHFLGTARRESLDVELDAVGGQSNASTGWEHTDYWYLAPAESFDLLLDLLSDQILNSTFPREAFDRERLVVYEELKRRDDDPSINSFDIFINTVFQASPLRQHPSGTIESVSTIPIETILAYKAQRYTTGNMVVAVAGNVRHDETVAKIDRAFAPLPQGPRLQRQRIPEPVQTAPRVHISGEGQNIAEIRLGWPAPGDDNEADAPAMTILEDILGTTGRRLAEEIRDRRALATSVDADYLAFSDAGALMLSATTRPDRADQVVQLLLEQVQRLRAGDVTDADVQASLRAIAGRRALADESNLRQTARAQIEVSEPLESWEEYMARLRGVTAADVRRVANTYLDPQNHTLVIVRG